LCVRNPRVTEVKSLDQLSLILGYIVPGLIILYVRSQFLTGRLGSHKDALLSYFTLSVIYLAVVEATTSLVTGSRLPLYDRTPYWLPIVLGGAAGFGVLIGLNASLGLTRWLASKIGLRLPHVMTSAWDWKFQRLPECLLMITLQDSSTVAGWFGDKGSFVGSDPTNRDIYIEQLFELDKEGNLVILNPGKGIYISSGEIRLIEFIPEYTGKA
jgi:hypothetical protein